MRLHEQVKEQQKIIATYEQQITDLFVYLASSKFRCGDPLDGYVNIQDIRNRLIIL